MSALPLNTSDVDAVGTGWKPPTYPAATVAPKPVVLPTVVATQVQLGNIVAGYSGLLLGLIFVAAIGWAVYRLNRNTGRVYLFALVVLVLLFNIRYISPLLTKVRYASAGA